MKQHKKMKPSEIAALVVIILAVCVALSPFAMFGLYVLGESETHLFGCHHRLNPVVSAELVSQEAPLAFFELMEQPTIAGIKVRLTYEDGSSEVVDAYQSKEHYRFGVGHTHEVGMYFQDFSDFGSSLEPGVHLVPMYCVDIVYSYRDDPRFDDKPDLAHCLVEVYAQTGDEYLAANDVPHTTVTPSEDGILALEEWRDGIIRFLAEEDGTYEITIDSHCTFSALEYTGNGLMFKGLEGVLDGMDFVGIDLSALMEGLGDIFGTLPQKTEGQSIYARLNAGEPLFLKAYSFGRDESTPLHITMARLPDVWIALGEAITVTEPSALHIRDFDSTKAKARAFDSGVFPDGFYVLEGTNHDHYNLYDMNLSAAPHPVWEGHVIVPREGSAAITLTLSE